MNQPTTCGQGLAAYASLPAALAELIRLLGATLDAHMPSIDTDDDHGRAELRAYESLATQYRTIAHQLSAAATEMAAAHDLPMARHHDTVLHDPRTFQPFRDFVAHEQRLIEQLQDMLTRDLLMIDALDSDR